MSDMLSNLLNKETLDKLFSIIMNDNEETQRMIDEKITAVLKENKFCERYYVTFIYRGIIKDFLKYLVTCRTQSNKEIDKKGIVKMLLRINSSWYGKSVVPYLREMPFINDKNELIPNGHLVFSSNSRTNNNSVEILTNIPSYKNYYLNFTLMISGFILKNLLDEYFPEEVISEESSIEQPKKLVRKKTEEQ